MKIYLAVFTCLLISFAAAAKGKSTELTYEQYQVDLASIIQREKSAREEIAKEQAQIENLQQLVLEIRNRIAAIIVAKYALLGISEQDVSDAEIELGLIRSALNPFMYLAADDLLNRSSEIAALESRFLVIKSKKVSWLFKITKIVDEIEPALNQVKNQLQLAQARPKAPVEKPSIKSSYRVTGAIGSTNLSMIAAQVYGNQYEWPRIYRANKKLIDKGFAAYKNALSDPKIERPQDFLRPGWELTIP